MQKKNKKSTEKRNVEVITIKYGTQGYQAQAESFSSEVVNNTNRIREIHSENTDSPDTNQKKSSDEKSRAASLLLSLITG